MGGLQPKRWKDNANASCEHSFRRVTKPGWAIGRVRWAATLTKGFQKPYKRRVRRHDLRVLNRKPQKVLFFLWKMTSSFFAPSEGSAAPNNLEVGIIPTCCNIFACPGRDCTHFTHPKKPSKLLFAKILARVNHQIRTVRTGKLLSFSWFSFCVVYPVWRPGPQYNVRLVRQTFTSGGQVWAAPPLRSFKILKS